MKKNFKAIFGAIIMLILFGTLMYIVFLSTPVRPRLEYYSQEGNYITATGTVCHLGWSSDQSYVCLAFEDIPDEYSDPNFVIEGENLRILMENGFAEKVQLGTQVVYISAPRYFWDGYAMPIVALEVDGESLLTFEEGKANLLELIKQ
ncbi:MAG: hypothetical protein E7465_05240 [Ruminococcaceae bacterium]|nr:hypothetical protein [Oscillospiraceae bacterium]